MLKIQTRNLGNIAVLSLQGRIVNGETATLREAVRAQSSAGAIVLDVAGVSTIDASGLGLLLQVRNEFQARGVRLRVMNASGLVASSIRRPSIYGQSSTWRNERPCSGNCFLSSSVLNSTNFADGSGSKRLIKLASGKPVQPFARCA